MIVWPFYPNWTHSYSESYAYLTEILTSHAGREQRRARRKCARRTIEYRSLVVGDDLITLRAIQNRRDETLTFPDEVRRVSPSAAAAQGSTAVTFASLPAWLAVGRSVVFEDGSTRERTVRTVASIAGATVTFTDAATRAWATNTRVMPALSGRLAPSASSTFLTNEAGEVIVSLEVEPGTEYEDVGAAVATFDGREVMTIKPNWTRSPTIEVDDPTQWTDNEMGVRTAYRPVSFNTEIRQAEYLLRSAADVDAVLGAFQRAKGRRGEFFQASGLNDFTLMQTVSTGSALWRVAGHDFHAAYDGDDTYRAFAVTLRSGVTLRFVIYDIEAISAAEPYSRIQTMTTAPYAIAPEDIVMISWLPVVRFSSDELTLTWRTNSMAEVLVNTQTVEYVP